MSAWPQLFDGGHDAELAEPFAADDALELAESLEREKLEALEEAAYEAQVRDRARLDAQLRERLKVVELLQQSAAGLSDASARALALERAAEYKRAVELASVADGRSVSRKRAREARPLAPVARHAAARLFAADEWLWETREAADAVIDEDLQAQQHMLTLVPAHVLVGGVAPVRGQRRVVQMASSVADMRLERWMLAHTTPLFTTNIVATADFGVSINALTLVNRISGASFNPRCFAAVKVRVHDSTHLIFSEGMVVCTGSKSTENARIACIDTAHMLVRVGVQAQFLRFEVRNVVSTSNTGFDVDLAAIANTYPINAHYMPDCFPGLMFRVAQARMVLIVFKSGCCILTGVKSRRDALVAWTWFYCNILWHFQAAGATQMSDVEYGRRARQDDSTVELVCESVRDVTQSLVASAIARERPALDTPADHYFAALREMTRQLGPVPTQTQQRAKLDLESWLAAEAARESAL